MSKKHIMIIGAGILQVPAIQIAHEMGLSTIVTDMNPNAYGLKISHHPIVMSTKDIEGTVRAARELNKTVKIDGVMTIGTDASMTVAAVANALNLPGIKTSVAEAAVNKMKMRNKLKTAGVPVPEYRSVWSYEELVNAFKELSCECVLKPTDNMGARGVRKVTNEKELKQAFELAKSCSPSGELILEEYMQGPELSIDALIWKDEIHICGVADRIIEYPPYFVETGHIMPSNLPDEQLNNAVDIFKNGIKALGIDIGAAKGDIKVTKSGAKIGEIAARLSGGFMSAYTYPYATGVNLIKNAICIALGEPPSDLKPKFNKVAIEKAIIPASGRVKSIIGVDEALNLEGVKNIFLRVEVGDYVKMPINNIEKAGNLICVGENRDSAWEEINNALDILKINTVKEDELNWKDIKKKALERFNGTCFVCPECDGIQCRGQLPGMGGVGTSASFINNVKELRKYKLIPSYIHDVNKPDTTANFLGIELSMPVLVAPITGTKTNMGGGMSEEEYANAVVSGAILSKTIAFVGDGATPEKYKIGIEAGAGNSGMAIPVFKPRENQNEIIKRAKYARDMGLPAFGIDIDAASFLTMALKGQAVEPKSVEKIQEITKAVGLPLILKGIMSVRDALFAVKAGAEAIIVSNHGGRILDDMPGAMAVLPEIVKAVKGKVTIIADGGVRTGTDAARYLAFGADLVMIGRPAAIGAFGGDEAGVSFVLDRIKQELFKVMLLTGTPNIKSFNKNSFMLGE